MLRTFIKSVMVALVVYSGSATAGIIPISQNPALPTGAVAPGAFFSGIAAYNPSHPSAWPTPYNYAALNPPVARDYFTAGEVVSVAQVIDLNLLTPADDYSISGTPNTWADNDDTLFQWSAFWYDTLALPATPVNANFYSVRWDDISSWKASGYDALVFWADDGYMPAAGTWIVDTYFEGAYSNSVVFNVPEPSTLFLLGLGLVGVVVRKRVAA